MDSRFVDGISKPCGGSVSIQAVSMDDMVSVVMAYSAHRLLFEFDGEGISFDRKDVWVRNFDRRFEPKVNLTVQFISCLKKINPTSGIAQWIKFASSIDDENSRLEKSSEDITKLLSKEAKELAVPEGAAAVGKGGCEAEVAAVVNESNASTKQGEEDAAAREGDKDETKGSDLKGDFDDVNKGVEDKDDASPVSLFFLMSMSLL